MSADTVEQADAQAEQAGKEIPPFSFSARMKPKRLTGGKKTTVIRRKVTERGLNVFLFCLCRVSKS